MDRGAWQATVHGVVRVRHDLATKPPPLCDYICYLLGIQGFYDRFLLLWQSGCYVYIFSCWHFYLFLLFQMLIWNRYLLVVIISLSQTFLIYHWTWPYQVLLFCLPSLICRTTLKIIKKETNLLHSFTFSWPLPHMFSRYDFPS